jgi:hypothetical protein
LGKRACSCLQRKALAADLAVRIFTESEAVTKLVPSAKADSVCSTLAFPALPCRAFRCGRSAAGAQLSPPSLRSTEFRNSLFRCGLHSYAASQLITWSWFRCVSGDGRGRLSSNKNSGSRTQWCDEGQLIQVVLRYAGRSEGQLGDWKRESTDYCVPPNQTSPFLGVVAQRPCRLFPASALRLAPRFCRSGSKRPIGPGD